MPSGLPVTEITSALTQAVQPGPRRLGRGSETRTLLGCEAAVNTESSFSFSMRLTSGAGSSGGGSGALARKNSGTGERTSAKPQPASVSAAPAISAM